MNKEKKLEYIKKLCELEKEKRFSEHVLKNRKKLKNIKFDETFDYTMTNSKIKRGATAFFSNFVGLFILPVFAVICNRIRIVGKKNLSGLKGYISVCNHNFLYDTLLCYRATFSLRKRTWVISLEENIQMPVGPILRGLGCVPIPRSDLGGLKKFSRAIDSELKHNKHIHIMPEGSLWMFYNKVRPFLSGGASYAVRNNVPVVPLCIGKRGETKILNKDKLTLYVGAPIYPDLSLRKGLAVEKLNQEAYDVVNSTLRKHYEKYPNVKL